MNAGEREFINELTEAVIQHYNIQIPIHDIYEVVSQIGGKVDANCTIDDVLDGSIKKVGNSFVISIVPYQPPNRINFTIAHELGHLFLHMGYNINQQLWEKQDESPYYRFGSTEKEKQANEFAAALLMPKDLYVQVMDKYTDGNIVDTAKIAEYFHVSVDAASNRGKWLGYLEW